MTHEEHQSTPESNEHERSAEISNISAPKLSPVVVLTNVTNSSPQDTTASPSLTHETPQLTEDCTKKRKYTRRKGKGADPNEPATLEDTDSTSTSPKKKQRIGIQQESFWGPAHLYIKRDPDAMPIKTEPGADDDNSRMDSFGADFGDIEMLDLGKDLTLKPADFGLTEDDNLLFKSDDFQLSFSDDDDLAALKPEDFDINPDDFVIKDVGLETIKNLNIGQTPVPVGGTAGKDNAGAESKRLGRTPMAPKVAGGHSLSCQLCPFYGRKIVDHYVNNHAGITIPQARLSESAFTLLKQGNKSDSPQLMEIRFSSADIIRCSFCNIPISTMANYCQHLTHHTGEFRFQCSVCSIKFPTKALAAGHCKVHKKDNIENSECLIETPLPLEVLENEFYGYICGECNYFQIDSENIRAHLDITKHSETDIVCIQFKGPKNQNLGQSALKKPPKPPSLVPYRDDTPPPLPESSKSVFFHSKEVPEEDPPRIPSAELKRYRITKISRITQVFQRYAEYRSEQGEEGAEVRPATNLESDAEMLRAATEAVNALVNTITCGEEIEAVAQGLTAISMESERTFASDSLKFETRPETSNIGDSDGYSTCDSEDEDHVNDFYGDEEPSESESGMDSNEKDTTSMDDQSVAEIVCSELSTSQSVEVTKQSPMIGKSPFSQSQPRSSSSVLIGTPSSTLPSLLQIIEEEDGVKDLEGTSVNFSHFFNSLYFF